MNSSTEAQSLAIDVYRSRRDRVLAALRESGGGIAIVPTAREVMRNRDADYPFRHDSYFYYLTGFTEPEATLVLDASAEADEPAAILFCREKNAERETWDGFRHGPEGARLALGFDAAFPIDQLDAEMPRLLADNPALHYALGSSAELDAQVRGWLAAVRAQSRIGVKAPLRANDLLPMLDEMRLIKDAHELSIMRRAGTISAEAHRRAMQTCRPGMHEYEIEAELLYTFRRRGAQAPAYGSIVAAGANACTLHYPAGNAIVREGDLILIDAACELDGYASDITRTFPASGRFTSAQREIYDIVLASVSMRRTKRRCVCWRRVCWTRALSIRTSSPPSTMSSPSALISVSTCIGRATGSAWTCTMRAITATPTRNSTTRAHARGAR
jgi:Xaa-Pro aminopeptidase